MVVTSLLIPSTSLGQQGAGQVITSGDFSFLKIPDDAAFPVLATSNQEQRSVWSYATSPSGQPSDDRNLLIVEDLRDDGGFRVDVDLLQYQHQITGLPLDLIDGSNGGGAMFVATEAPGDYGTIISSNGIGYDVANTGPTDIIAPLDLAGADPEDANNYFMDLIGAVTLMDGPVPSGQGRTGQFQTAVNFVSMTSPFAPAGIYEAHILYTAYEATEDSGGLDPDPFDSSDDTGSGATLLLPPDTVQIDWGAQTLSDSDTEDWFVIDLIASETLNLTAIAMEGAVTATLCEDINCSTIVPGNTPTSAGRYYIRVTEDTGGDARYILQYSYSSQPADSFDSSDDACSSATSISPTGTEQNHGLHTLSSTDTEDWYSFTGATSTIFNFNSIISNGILQIELFDSCGSSTFFSDTSSGGSSDTGSYFYLDAEDLVNQTYYLKVSSAIPNDDATYSLYYSKGIGGAGEHSDDFFDHTPTGDDRGLSTPTSLNITTTTQVHTNHTLSPSDIYDMFSFSAVSGNVYNFTSTNIYGDLKMEILDSSYNTVETSSNTSGAFNHNFSAASTDTYYVRVEANDNADGKVAAYDLEYTTL